MTYGEHGDGFLPNLARMVQKGRFRLIGRGDNCLHLVDVRNLVQGFVLTLGIARPRGEVYIIADEQPITLRRLVTIIADYYSVDVAKGNIPVWFASFAGLMLELAYKASFRSGEPPVTRSKIELLTKHRFYDVSKAKRELGYKPLIYTEDGVREVLSAI
jgi:nucleoside-diphosphate-sugar epimerase